MRAADADFTAFVPMFLIFSINMKVEKRFPIDSIIYIFYI